MMRDSRITLAALGFAVLFSSCGQGISLPANFNGSFNGNVSFLALKLVGFSYSMYGSPGFPTPVTLPYNVLSSTAGVLNTLSNPSDGTGVDFYPPSSSVPNYSQVDLVFAIPPGTNDGAYSSVAISTHVAAGTISGPSICGITVPDTTTGITPLNAGTGFTAAVMANSGFYTPSFASTADKSVSNSNAVVPFALPSLVVASTGAYTGNVIVISIMTNSPGAINSTCSFMTLYSIQVGLNP